MIRALFALFLTSSALAMSTQKDFAHQWEPLIEAGNVKDAGSLCRGWLKQRKDDAALAEAHKCLANVELAGAQSIQIGKESLAPGFAGPAVDRALAHLDEALKLAPQDLSIHQGRLHVLLRSGRFDELDRALEKSLSMRPPSSSLETWLPYADELRGMGEVEAGLNFSLVLAKHFPKDYRAVGNVGAFLAALHRDDEAIVYTKKAVQLKPDDPIDLWNLGILYDATRKFDLADNIFRESLRFETDDETRKDHYCRYAEFLAQKRHQRKAACEIEKKNCPQDAPDCGAP